MAQPLAPSPAFEDPAAAAFVRAIERLEEVIELETRSLQAYKGINLLDFNHRKQHGLLELSRIVRGLDRSGPNDPVRLRLASLRKKLEKNSSALQTHLKAVREIAAIVSRAIQDADSDGTYSATADFYGQRR